MRQTPVMDLEVKAIDDVPRRAARLQDGQRITMPARATFTPQEPTADFPEITIDIDESGGRIVVRSATLRAAEGQELRSDAVRNYSLPILAALACRDLTVDVGPDFLARQPDSAKAWASVVRAVRSRTAVDDDRLADVAGYHAAGGVWAVQRNLAVSRSQAYRLVAQARAAGFIEEGV